MRVIKLTSADWKVWNVFVREHSLVNHQVGQAAKTRPADDSHLRPLLSVCEKPVCCLLVLLIFISESNEITMTTFRERMRGKTHRHQTQFIKIPCQRHRRSEKEDSYSHEWL